VSNALKSLVAVAALVPAVALAEDPKVTLGGLVDSYYSLNLDQGQTVTDPIRAFDGTPGFRLSYAEVNATVAAGPASVRIDLGFAPTAIFTTNLLVQQAYASYSLGGVTLDFGRFVTSAGAEVIEAKDNPLYTRSILFTWAIPFAHTGLRATIPVGEGLNLQLGLVNGWDDDTTAATLGGGAAFGPQKVANVSLFYSKDALSAALNVYAGQEPTVPDFRTLVDVVLGYTSGPLTLNLNVDYGTENSQDWYGAALVAKYAAGTVNLSARGEYFDDKDGFRTGTVASYYEGTVGLAYPVGANAELRAELRYDAASEPVFNGEKGMSTATLAALAWF
jgi:hypothetical protein